MYIPYVFGNGYFISEIPCTYLLPLKLLNCSGAECLCLCLVAALARCLSPSLSFSLYRSFSFAVYCVSMCAGCDFVGLSLHGKKVRTVVLNKKGSVMWLVKRSTSLFYVISNKNQIS